MTESPELEAEIQELERSTKEAADQAIEEERQRTAERKARAARRVWIDRVVLIAIATMTAATLLFALHQSRERAEENAARDAAQVQRQAELVRRMDSLLNQIKKEQRENEQNRRRFIRAVELLLEASGIEEDPFPGSKANSDEVGLAPNQADARDAEDRQQASTGQQRDGGRTRQPTEPQPDPPADPPPQPPEDDGPIVEGEFCLENILCID